MYKMNRLNLISDGELLLNIPDDKLIRRFKIKNKNKTRDVNDPIPVLKDIMKIWNKSITRHYRDRLAKAGLSDIAHAYLPGKSIQTNARAHTKSMIIQFDFKGFYDSCKFEYFKNDLRMLDSGITDQNEYILKRLMIDPNTNGVTQGLPVSGALAGIALIPFWITLRNILPENVVFTQYSDDLTFSFTGEKPDMFTVKQLTDTIYKALNSVNLKFKLNKEKTAVQKDQYRKVTGVRINHHNQLTPARNDYYFLKQALHILSKSDDLQKELDIWGFESEASFIGKISYLRSIDDTGKINKVIMKYRQTCRRHGLFETWIEKNYEQSAFA